MSNPKHQRESLTASVVDSSLRYHTANVAESDGQSSIRSTKSYPPANALYEDLANSSDLFWKNLQDFHKSLGASLKVPTIGGKQLDLYRLFIEVTSRGGLEKVIGDHKWKEVVTIFKFPNTVTSASFALRKYYQSLLYDFEQVYYFRKQVPSFSKPDSGSRSILTSKEGAALSDLPASTFEQQLGSLVPGTIDLKFDGGYVVTVNLGSDQLKGVLYHVPLNGSQSSASIPASQNRKRSRLGLHDPSRPKSNRSGYNFFFAEHYARLKPSYYGQERAISKKIGFLWNHLTEAERQIYQEKGRRDKERYRTEMEEYKASNNLTPQ
ncbi:high mobility group B protein 10-like [Neltuma alba]|uniref:high mobility group B protein 10-like n=1 Tax=Neltuma alba TaxID=207710 RepID=UPI0010A49911|nr:high mobility group B protein 10-like [Prosopis alba]XP_028784126.1 high mobility group B protein 10-like [Prosopis alba]